MRFLRLLGVAALSACALPANPQTELSVAEREIGGGDLGHGLPRMERAYRELDVTDPRSWDRLGELAQSADRDIAARAFVHAETLRWPDPRPQNAVAMGLPFEGRWLVTQGNRGSYSHERLADRFAWDFQAVDEKGESTDGQGATPAEFRSFGANVVAPADGEVVRARDGLPDNAIGARNEILAAGNVIVIRHGDHEFAHLCHLMCGSLRVARGQLVRRGDVIARCGCSGNAAEPHLHFVLRVGPTSDHDSIPARFDDLRVVRSGSDPPPADGVPRSGDVVEPAR